MNLTKAKKFLKKQGLSNRDFQDTGMLECIAEQMQKYADEQIKSAMASIFYKKEGEKYFIGDKMTGKFAFGETVGVIYFGEFDAYFPTGAHEWAYAFGFYVKTDKHEAYSICEINGLSKYIP